MNDATRDAVKLRAVKKLSGLLMRIEAAMRDGRREAEFYDQPHEALDALEAMDFNVDDEAGKVWW